ncbi:hypothetical protein B296_00046834 [Ensete ventricosum]|uniref:Uncharacterized protein n=1 Tax=Ensete ventricosum TaxID=4639 RepID=A0A426X093_ENSVE|nr:hypothetical protein B296_00046834 [Ensete ventricosum]
MTGGISSKFARRFAKGIGKLAGNTPRDHRKTCHKNVGGCQIGGTQVELNWLTKGLVDIRYFEWLTCPSRWVNRLYPGVRETEPPRLVGEPPVPKFSGYNWILAPVLKPIWGL